MCLGYTRNKLTLPNSLNLEDYAYLAECNVKSLDCERCDMTIGSDQPYLIQPTDMRCPTEEGAALMVMGVHTPLGWTVVRAREK